MMTTELYVGMCEKGIWQNGMRNKLMPNKPKLSPEHNKVKLR